MPGDPGAFVLGDALYGADRRPRRMLQARQQPHVLAVHSNGSLRLGGGSLELTTAERLAGKLKPDDWYCRGAGDGAKRPRLYDWPDTAAVASGPTLAALPA